MTHVHCMMEGKLMESSIILVLRYHIFNVYDKKMNWYMVYYRFILRFFIFVKNIRQASTSLKDASINLVCAINLLQ